MLFDFLDVNLEPISGVSTAGYEEAWKDYKRIRNQWLFVIVGYVPICMIAAFVSIKLFQTLRQPS